MPATPPTPKQGERLVVGGDASSILRVQSKTARDRTYVHASNLPDGVNPVRPGWQFSEIAVLPNEQSSFVYVLDNRRIESTRTQGEVMAQQLKEAIPRLAQRFVFLGDGYYGSQTLRAQTNALACEVLVRFAKNRLLYRAPRLLRSRRAGGIRPGMARRSSSAIPPPTPSPTSSGKASMLRQANCGAVLVALSSGLL